MGKIIAFPVERTKSHETALRVRTGGLQAFDTAAAAFAASFALMHACAHAWCSFGRGIGQAFAASSGHASPGTGPRR